MSSGGEVAHPLPQGSLVWTNGAPPQPIARDVLAFLRALAANRGHVQTSLRAADLSPMLDAAEVIEHANGRSCVACVAGCGVVERGRVERFPRPA